MAELRDIAYDRFGYPVAGGSIETHHYRLRRTDDAPTNLEMLAAIRAGKERRLQRAVARIGILNGRKQCQLLLKLQNERS